MPKLVRNLVEMISPEITPGDSITIIDETFIEKIIKVVSESDYSLVGLEADETPSYFPMTTLEITLNRYKVQLEDPATQASIFLSFLSEAGIADYEIVKKALYELFYDDYLTDFFTYIEDNQLELSFESISSYLSYKSVEETRLMKENFINRTYKTYGNPFMFLINSVLSDPNSNILKINSDLLVDPDSVLIRPAIDYIKSNAYRNFREAEEAYWNITGDFVDESNFFYSVTNKYGILFPIDYSSNLSKDLIAKLLNRSYMNNVNGIPLLMSSSSRKSLFSLKSEDDKNISDVLNGNFNHITKDEFYDLLDKMFLEIAEYSKVNDLDWETDDLLEDFLSDKLLDTEYLNAPNSEYEIERLKELRFYKVFLARFLGVLSHNSFNKISQLETEFSLLRDLFFEVKGYIVNKGYFN
jgi:uncharacterized protein YktA (UPF0223 family)